MIEQHKKALLQFYRQHRRMPGYNEMLELFGFRSKNAVYKVLNKLIEAGVIRKDVKGRILPVIMSGELRLLGTVEAGLPAVAEEAELDTLNVEEYMAGKAKGETYLLTVKGNSMIDAGIHNGDLVLVECTATAKPGQIVVAELDGEWTMKYLRERNGKHYLEAANPEYDDMYPESDLRIGGIVRGVIRRYQ
jgi:repressor LexA